MKLYLGTNSYSETTREPYSNDSWDGDSHTRWEFGDLSVKHDNLYSYETIEVDSSYKVGDTIYLVGVVWSTGDSFGNYGGACFDLVSAHRTYEAAKKAADYCESCQGDFFKYCGKTHDLGDGYVLTRIPWTGYFESLDYVEIFERIIEE